MGVEKELQGVLDYLNSQEPMYCLDVSVLRENMRASTKPSTLSQVQTRDLTIDTGDSSLPVRLYSLRLEEKQPLVLFFHGGGFVMGDLDTHDHVCREIAQGSDAKVLSVGYRLAPEYKFPAALDDCTAAVRWAAASPHELNTIPGALIVSGDSAGGNYAAAVSRRLCDVSGTASPILGQVLIYPVLDYPVPGTLSYLDNGEGYYLTREDMFAFWKYYLVHEDQAVDPDASPLRAQTLRGLPPTLVLTAEYDPLRDEGEAYASRLASEGVSAMVRRYDGTFHGFIRLTEISPAGRRAMSDLCLWIRDLCMKRFQTQS